MSKLLAITLFTFAAACGGKSDGAGGIGVPECDAYVQKMEACAKQVGGSTGASLERTTKMFADTWKDNAKDDSMKAQLPKTCGDALESAKKQLTKCQW